MRKDPAKLLISIIFIITILGLSGCSGDSAEILYNKGTGLYDMGRYEEAIECFDKAIAIAPNHSVAWSDKGMALSNIGRYEEAIECFDKAIEIAPNYSVAWSNKVLALSSMGRYEEVIECLNRAFQLGVFAGRNSPNSIKQAERKGSPKIAGIVTQFEELQYKPTVSQVSEPSEAEEVMQYTIQVGAFSSYQNARDMVNSLKAKGHTCWMEPESPSHTTQAGYRVFIGRFRTRKAGEQVGELLAQRMPSIIGYMIKKIKE
ncbi:tetratricopeptide repeat protein [Candidatus Poribacteria bacterium]